MTRPVPLRPGRTRIRPAAKPLPPRHKPVAPSRAAEGREKRRMWDIFVMVLLGVS